MLVIRRRPGQSLLIGNDVEVQVTEIEQGRVKLCVTAPKNVLVDRKEVRLTREANLASARVRVGRISHFAARLGANSSSPPALR